MKKPKYIRQQFEPFHRGTDRDKLSFFQFCKRLFGMTLGITGFVICLVLLFLGMREVMKLGGFVASGGPYHIAHQAPDWIWVMPASIFGGMFFILINFFNARKIGGIKSIVLLWPALFLSLGYNFLEFAFFPPGENSGIIIGWLICGILFVLMGGIPFIVILKSVFVFIKNSTKDKPKTFASYYTTPEPDDGKTYINKTFVSTTVVILNFAGISGGIYLGLIIFKLLSS